jgi:hypothetical protein
MSFEHKSRTIEISKGADPTTLAWDGDVLVDVATARRFGLDGSVSDANFYTPFKFDRGLCFRDGNNLWSIAYANRGTKALLFKNGKEHRELNRSYYFAESYDYPIALARVDARVVVFHCPTAYNVVELEDAESGKILWSKKTKEMEFHSRLAVSDNGKFLLSAGWFWHPLGGAWLSRIGLGTQLESSEEVGFSFGAEIDGAAFLDDDHVVISSTNEVIDAEDGFTGSRIGPMQLGVWSISEARWVSSVPITGVTGSIMPWRDWIISFYEHPKAIDLATGTIVHIWSEIDSGHQIGSIQLGDPLPPMLALNQRSGMFAVADGTKIHVVSLHDNL